MNDKTKRVFSGIQPSGDIHIGNYLGAVKKWIELTDEYECFYSVVDNHAITVDYDHKNMPTQIFNAVLATMACGLDPQKCVLFVQSHVPQHAELTWLFNTITPLGSLFRMTQFKDKARNALKRALSKREGKSRKTALHQLKNVGDKSVSMLMDLREDVGKIDPGAKFSAAQEQEIGDFIGRINDRMGTIMQHLQVGLGVAEASAGLFGYPVLQAADIL